MSFKKASILALGLSVLLPAVAQADQDPTTDNVPRLFAYGGLLEKDGATVSGDVTMTFKLFDAPQAASGTALWRETQTVQVYGGHFSVLLGECDGQSSPTARCPLGDDDGAASIEQMVVNADDLYLAVDLDDGSGPVPMQHRKRFVPVPYAVWSSSATNLEVAQDLAVGRSLTLGGPATIAGDVAAGRDLAVTRNLTAGGTATVDGKVTARSGLAVTGDTTMGGKLDVTGDAKVSGVLDFGYETVSCAAARCYCPAGKRPISWTMSCSGSAHALYSAGWATNTDGTTGIYCRCWHSNGNVYDAASTGVLCARVK
ncbi:MAG: hypothetical protein ABIJ09_07395 [Pseudomonadota bacterium]